MALIKADRVKESSTSAGTGSFLLNGAYTGFRSFSSVCSVGDTFYYVIDSDLGSEWETGLGTYSAVNTLTRTTIHSSSNSNNIVTFSAGTKNVYISLTGNQLGTLSTLTGSETLTNKTINASNNTITNVSLTSGVTGILPLANGGTGTTTAQLAINALAGAVTSGSYLRGNGTNVVMATISAGDVPTLNQNTTGTASGSVSGTASYLAKFTGTNVVGNSVIVEDTSSTTATLIATTNTAYDVIGLRNTNASGYSSLRIIDSAGTSRIAFGYGNSTSALPGAYIYGYTSDGLGIYTNAAQRMYIGSGGNVGIGDSPAIAYRLKVQHTGTGALQLTSTGASAASPTLNLYDLTNGTTGGFSCISGGVALGAISNHSLQLLVNATERMRIDTSGNVGIGTTSTSDKLHVIGNIRAGNYTAGAGTYLALTGDLPGYASGTYPTLKSDGTIYLSANGKYSGYFGDGSNTFGLNRFSDNLLTTLLRPGGTSYFTGGSVAFGATTAPAGQLYVTPQAAATKGLVVRGASAQSANLQEWQNSAGTVLAAVNSAGTLTPYGGIYTSVTNGFMSQLYMTQQVSEYTRSFYRTLPSVVGDYIEFVEVNDTNSPRYEFSISVISYPYWNLKRYEFTATWSGATNGVVPPVAISNRNYALDYDFELETVSVGSYYRRFRIKRTKGTTGNVQAMVLMRIFGDYVDYQTEITGTGTSTYSSYINRSYDYVNPNIAAPPPANYSGNGTPLSLSASSAVTTGAGGSLTLQAGNAAGTGTGGSVTLYTGAGAGTGVGGMIQSRSRADSYNRSNKFILVRSIPDTVGDYVELGRTSWSHAAVLKVSVFASRGAYDAANGTYNTLCKQYEFYAHYYSSGTVAPRTVSGGSAGGRQPNEFELELAFNAGLGSQTLRLRRSKADATNFSGYTATIVIKQVVWSPHAMDFVELSGTGTSAYGNAYLTNTGSYCYPVLIPPPTGGTSGAGTNLAIYGGSAIGTGAGGSISLAPGNSAGVAAPGFINLSLPQPADGSQASCVTLGVYKTHYFTRTVPITAGDYVEICEISDGWVGRIKISIMTYQHAAEGGSFKSYDFSPTALYNTSGIIQPTAHNGANGWELEKYVPSVSVSRLRIRRTVTISASPLCDAWIVIERLDYSNSLLKYSGTGTSTVANTLLSSSLVAQTLIKPGPPVANNGAGKDITVQGGNAAGTGAGGSILLQAGAYATSGSNGKVIVRGLASNTANLQEWQNNAGSVLSAVKSDGSIQPASMADSAATNNSIYYSTTASKLVYKDAAGTVNNLY